MTSAIKRALARLLHPLEARLDAMKGHGQRPVRIVPFEGYESPEGVVLRGRILSFVDPPKRRDRPNKLHNAWAFLRLFFTDERRDRPVRLVGAQQEVLSDDEGYFRLVVPRAVDDGRAAYEVACDGERAAVPVHRVAPGAPFGVISDIDDTVMHTGAWSIWLNLWTSLTGNVASRRVFDGTRAMLAQFAAAGAPVFYVSSSPWNIHGFLAEVFARNGVPPGPMFLRDLGLSERKAIAGSHGRHKTGAIETILAANPDLAFILVGDTGQHDPEIYTALARANPGRVRRIVLRQPVEPLPLSAQAAVAAARAEGMDVVVARELSAAL